MATKINNKFIICPIMKAYPKPICYCDRIILRKKLPSRISCHNGQQCNIGVYFTTEQIENVLLRQSCK